ncbi:MAG: hypothetical protein EBQ78_03060, partial [Betaproteobacteria bacterium]|nr:hypothetical protein [Betaproteobacteria bacterium]
METGRSIKHQQTVVNRIDQNHPHREHLAQTEAYENRTPHPDQRFVSDLSPTQCCVGYLEVQDKRAQWERLSNRARRTALDQHYFPTIIGPDDRPFIIDHHHLALACTR